MNLFKHLCYGWSFVWGICLLSISLIDSRGHSPFVDKIYDNQLTIENFIICTIVYPLIGWALGILLAFLFATVFAKGDQKTDETEE